MQIIEFKRTNVKTLQKQVHPLLHHSLRSTGHSICSCHEPPCPAYNESTRAHPCWWRRITQISRATIKGPERWGRRDVCPPLVMSQQKKADVIRIRIGSPLFRRVGAATLIVNPREDILPSRHVWCASCDWEAVTWRARTIAGCRDRPCQRKGRPLLIWWSVPITGGDGISGLDGHNFYR